MDRPLLYKRLGQTIRERRRGLGLTQERLSKQLGISRSSLSNVENCIIYTS
ncbi:MAG: helix-turn-helix transcriptional regulator, partial [Chloroflexota bacterium]|nr:helix-turn-helix transcriptional regulator [Chloroflexota bacterium]